MSFKKKFSITSQPQPVRPHYLKVSPYENPEVTLELMGKICAAQPKVSVNDFNKAYVQVVEREFGHVDALKDYIETENLPCRWETFESIKSSIATTLTEQGQQQDDYTYVVVAGGYSSGKSSFLNNLVQQKSLLPTGTQPVSVVNTCLYCSKHAQQLTVQGINLRQATVELEPGVLQAIQHAEDSEVYLASVLNKLFVTIPSKGLHGLAFIDTPGYNNGLSANAFNGKTDEETAREAYQQGDVLFWFIGIDKGTVNAEDLKKIKEFQGKKAIIFTQADKKGKKESRNIVEAAYTILSKYFDTNDLLDVMAYSALDNKVYYARRYHTLSALLKAVLQAKVEEGSGGKIAQLQAEYSTCFDELIKRCEVFERIEKEKCEMLVEKDKDFYYHLDALSKENEIAMASMLDFGDSYHQLVKGYDTLCKLYVEAHNKGVNTARDIRKSHNRQWFPKADIDEMCNGLEHFLIYDTLVRYKQIDVKKYSEEDIEAFIRRTKRLQKQVYVNAEVESEENKNSLTQARHIYKKHQDSIQKLQHFKRVYTQALDTAIRTYYKKDVATPVEVVKQSYDVFESIKSRHYKAFLRSFEFGVELSLCNTEGFTPLTYAAHYGNDAMVDFLLHHDADCAGVDKRGYNALHTALLAGHKGICERLLSHCPSLKNTLACPNGEHKPIDQLIEESHFPQWAKQTLTS